jgi:CRP/FNR family transcriptional regulator
MHSNNDFACAVIQHRSTHSTYFYKRLVSLTQKQMMGRMADGLLYLSSEFYRSLKFELNLSRQDIADLTAMSKDSAIRILKEFERDHIISMSTKEIEILDHETLQKISAMG